MITFYMPAYKDRTDEEIYEMASDGDIHCQHELFGRAKIHKKQGDFETAMNLFHLAGQCYRNQIKNGNRQRTAIKIENRNSKENLVNQFYIDMIEEWFFINDTTPQLSKELPVKLEMKEINYDIIMKLESTDYFFEKLMRFVFETYDNSTPGMDQSGPVRILARIIQCYFGDRDEYYFEKLLKNPTVRIAIEIIINKINIHNIRLTS